MRKELFKPLSVGSLHRIADLFGAERTSFREIARRDNIVIEAARRAHPIILRISHGARRTPDQVEAEIAWINTLLAEKVSVCQPLLSLQNRFVETIQAEDVTLSIAAFDKLPGQSPTRADWNTQLFEMWGNLLGCLHASAACHSTNSPKIGRPEWHQESNFALRALIPPRQKDFLREAENLIQEVRRFPVDNSVYGLTHGDFHQENIHLDNGRLTAFDFDDVQYSWFVSDIAITLYYACWKRPEGQSIEDYIQTFLSFFLTGYRQKMDISSASVELIPKLLKLRHVFMYANHYRTWDFNKINEQQRIGIKQHREGIGAYPNFEIDFSGM